jgi:hypothetical protein
LFQQLDNSRANSEDSLKDVAVALAAMDQILESVENKEVNEKQEDENNVIL